MSGKKRQIEEVLVRHGAGFELLGAEDWDTAHEHWLDTFARNVKRETGERIHRRFRWHGFSYGFEEAIEGQEALRAYLGQWAAPFIVFDEDATGVYRCSGAGYPDFTTLELDIYVAHKNMKWTMAFTHEQPHLGPYFAMRTSPGGST